jgi:hypothetical protein
MDDPAALTAARSRRRRSVAVPPFAHAAIALAFLAGGSSRCAARRTPVNDYGVQRCPSGAADDLLSVDALQCWFVAHHGRWRTLSHESHYDVIVIDVEALDVRDADEIAHRFVAGERRKFSEILVYVHPDDPRNSTRTRRVRWTHASGFEAFDFAAPPA